MAQIAFFSSSRNLPHTLRKRGARENEREAPRLFKSGDAAFFVPKNAFFKDGRYAVACSGTLSCKQALRELLSERGVNERTENEARLLCRAFACFGEKLTEKIQGSYALLVYDCVDRAIYGFCDKTGSKTLYYRLTESGISVATEPSQIAKDPYACDKALRAVLRTYLTVGYTVGEGTFYSEVQRLPQGHRLHWQGGKFSLYKWAEYTFAPADLECHSRLEGALKNALQAVPREGALLLSGSVFSSLMAAFSKKEKAVSLSFEGLAQTAIPSRLADLFSLKHETLAFTSSDCLQGTADLAKKSPTPLADPAALSYYLLAKHTDTPIVCAEGAAELYGGHRDYYVDEVAKQLRPTLTRYFALKQSKEIARYKLGRTSAFADGEALSLLTPPYRCAPSAKDNLRHYLTRSPSPHPTDGRQYADLCTYLAQNRLLAINAAFEASGKAVFLPYLDQASVDTALSLPVSARVSREVSAPAFRAVAAKYLPIDVTQSVLELPLPPLGRYLRWDLFSASMREVFSDPLAALFFDRHLLFSMLESHQNGTANHARKLWSAYLFLLWYDSHRL